MKKIKERGVNLALVGIVAEGWGHRRQFNILFLDDKLNGILRMGNSLRLPIGRLINQQLHEENSTNQGA
jgi:hypothetical protein